MIKDFPKETVDIIIRHFLKNGKSFREIRDIMSEVKDFMPVSLGYISGVYQELQERNERINKKLKMKHGKTT